MVYWFKKVIKEYRQKRKLHSLKYIPHEWAGKVIEPPSQESLTIAKRVLKVLHKKDLHPDRIISSGFGGIAFCWLPTKLPAYASIEVLNHEKLLLLSIVSSNGKDSYSEFTENTLNIQLDKINQFIINMRNK